MEPVAIPESERAPRAQIVSEYKDIERSGAGLRHGGTWIEMRGQGALGLVRGHIMARTRTAIEQFYDRIEYDYTETLVSAVNDPTFILNDPAILSKHIPYLITHNTLTDNVSPLYIAAAFNCFAVSPSSILVYNKDRFKVMVTALDLKIETAHNLAIYCEMIKRANEMYVYKLIYDAVKSENIKYIMVPDMLLQPYIMCSLIMLGLISACVFHDGATLGGAIQHMADYFGLFIHKSGRHITVSSQSDSTGPSSEITVQYNKTNPLVRRHIPMQSLSSSSSFDVWQKLGTFKVYNVKKPPNNLKIMLGLWY